MTLAKKKVKRKCSSERDMKSKATAELGNGRYKKALEKKNIAPDHVPLKRFCKSI